MKKIYYIYILILLSFFLIGCCQKAEIQEDTSQSSIPDTALEPTPEPIVILGQLVDENCKSIDLSNMSKSDVSMITSTLCELSNLEKIILSSNTSVDDFITIAKCVPNAEIVYSFNLFGEEIDVQNTERLDYKKVEIGDEGLQQFRKILPHLKHLKKLSFDRCGTSDEACSQLRDDFPDKEIVWRIYFGDSFTCMTDAETIWASCDLRDNTTQALKYCTKLKNLDIGHNPITDLSFLRYMPDLDVLIIGGSDIVDISDVAFCKKLTYFECEECRIKDLSPIAELENLEHVNVGNNLLVSDLSPLYGLKHLKRLFATEMYNPALNMTEEQEKLQALMPSAEVDCGWYGVGPCSGRWRFRHGLMGIDESGYVEEYEHIRSIFGYDYLEDSPVRLRISDLE